MAFKNPNDQAIDMQKPVTSGFKLDKEKYPDVEETPYGFIYNVGGRSITDATAERKKLMPELYKEGNDYGWHLTVDGDESYYPSFEEAYKAAKGIK